MIILCSFPCYHFKGYTFEMTHCGPWPLRKDGEPWQGRPRKAFWEAATEWGQLPKEEQEKYRASRVWGV